MFNWLFSEGIVAIPHIALFSVKVGVTPIMQKKRIVFLEFEICCSPES